MAARVGVAAAAAASAMTACVLAGNGPVPRRRWAVVPTAAAATSPPSGAVDDDDDDDDGTPAAAAAAAAADAAESAKAARAAAAAVPEAVRVRRHEKCCAQVAADLHEEKGDPLVLALLRAIEARGCELPGDFFRCVPCNDVEAAVAAAAAAASAAATTTTTTTTTAADGHGANSESGETGGGGASPTPTAVGGFAGHGASFDPRVGVSVCEDRMAHRGSARSALVHELVHAYDYCRVRIDFTDADHVACTEIRASNLSGECGFGRELLTRGRFGLRKHHQDCVRRRATLSTAQHFGTEVAEAAVNRVWDHCFNDLDPFDEIPTGR